MRAESKHGKRLNPRKADLHRWRETFAERLRVWGVEAEATRQATRGRNRNYEPLWRIKAREDGRLHASRPNTKTGLQAQSFRTEAVEAWVQIGQALATSTDKADRDLARSIAMFIQEMPSTQHAIEPHRAPEVAPEPKTTTIDINRS